MRILGWGIAFVGVIFGALFLPWQVVISVMFALVCGYLAFQYLAIATLLLIFLFPFIGLVVDFSQIPFLRTVPFLGEVNAPLGDIVAIFVLLAWGIKMVGTLVHEVDAQGLRGAKRADIRLPAIYATIMFWISGVASWVHVPEQWLAKSIKYLLRPIIFFYVTYILVVVNIIRTERLFRWAVWAMWCAGSIGAVLGIISFFAVPPVGFPRATVFAIFGVAPFGTNHNLLAETLIATAPLGLALLQWYSKRTTRAWIIAGSLVQVAIALLTFARTAWICLTVQAFIWVVTAGRVRAGQVIRRLAPALMVFIPLAIIMVTASLSEVVQSSTMTRADMARIALFYFERTPIFGQGVGTYELNLWTIFSFTRDYGVPLDAHGVIWKLLFEQGLFGLVSFAALIGICVHRVWQSWCSVYWTSGRAILQSMLLMMAGSVVYQVFNTQYYTSKLWVPMGVGLAASYIYNDRKTRVV